MSNPLNGLGLAARDVGQKGISQTLAVASNTTVYGTLGSPVLIAQAGSLTAATVDSLSVTGGLTVGRLVATPVLFAYWRLTTNLTFPALTASVVLNTTNFTFQSCSVLPPGVTAGSLLNASTGALTVPVTGVYATTIWGRYANNTTSASMRNGLGVLGPSTTSISTRLASMQNEFAGAQATYQGGLALSASWMGRLAAGTVISPSWFSGGGTSNQVLTTVFGGAGVILTLVQQLA